MTRIQSLETATRAAVTKYRNVRLAGHHDEIALHEATIAALVSLATPQQLADARGAASQAVIAYAAEQDAATTGCDYCDERGHDRCECDDEPRGVTPTGFENGRQTYY